MTMKSFKDFLTEANKWVSSSTDKDYSYDEKDDKQEKQLGKQKAISFDDITGKERKNVNIWVLDFWRRDDNRVFTGKRDLLIRKLTEKYTGEHTLYALRDKDDRYSQFEEISSTKDLLNRGHYPYIMDVLKLLESTEGALDKDCNIFILDTDLFKFKNLTAERDKLKELSEKTQIIFYAIKNGWHGNENKANPVFDKALEDGKFEIYVIK